MKKEKFISINPFTEELNAEFDVLSRVELDEKIKIAYYSYLYWKNLDKKEKKSLMLKLSEVILKNQAELTEIETKEMWMLYSASFAWLTKTANLIKWFAENFEEILKEEVYESNWLKVLSQYDPIWVIYGIAPWNFPFNQVLRAAVPNILAWNTVIYKHAENTPLAWKRIEELFLEAGFPVWVYQNIFASTSDTEYILSKNEVQGVNLTGSERAWSIVWSLAWKYLKRSVLELGGNDAFIVAETSDIKKVAEDAVKIRMANWWQKCNSSKRFIVPEKYYDDFCRFAFEAVKNLIVWDPKDEKTQVWPLARKDLVLEIDKQVKKTISEWAELLVWWEIIDRKWFFYSPTILASVTKEMTSFKEEIFWPVLSIIKVKDISEAIKLANESEFWLSACVFWDDNDEIVNIAKRLEWWMIFLNKGAASQVSLPFGWVKKSGYWKENWPEWLKAFTNKKVIIL